MRKLAVLALAVVALSVVVMFGTAGPVVSQQPAERQTITMFDPKATTFDKFLNEGKRGISPGDTILFIENQLDPETCERMGQLVGRIQVVKSVGTRDALYDGQFSVNLDSGKIVAAAAAKFSEFEGGEPVFAVTGGTGTYKDASGEVTFGPEKVDLCGTRGDLVTIDIGPVK